MSNKENEMMDVNDARNLFDLHNFFVNKRLLTKDEVLELASVYNKALERIQKEVLIEED